jgi:hypothetical protein
MKYNLTPEQEDRAAAITLLIEQLDNLGDEVKRLRDISHLVATLPHEWYSISVLLGNATDALSVASSLAVRGRSTLLDVKDVPF